VTRGLETVESGDLIFFEKGATERTNCPTYNKNLCIRFLSGIDVVNILNGTAIHVSSSYNPQMAKIFIIIPFRQIVNQVFIF
jgi:hypothetical protein